ncbi:MAG: orotidine-5'-phosphate decarboxylase [Deltaproteobacteria bacterium]|nr:orotidine-5'-phosphate decarboxylase [Deltaproteobacteria bacterium]
MKNIPNNAPREHLIFALDVAGEIEEALAWVERLRDHVGMFKVGKESFAGYGPEIVREIRARGGKVFLDLKFHDIPHTVARAAEASVRMGVSMFNVHALGGEKMMAEAVSAAVRAARAADSAVPIVLAVTVLTSLGDDDLKGFGFQCSAGELTLHLAKMAKNAGIHGVVASARDVSAVREVCGRDFVIVTPGIRSATDIPGDDQKRTLTPADAIGRGADYLVVGRPILLAQDPVHAADDMAGDIAAGLLLRQ